MTPEGADSGAHRRGRTARARIDPAVRHRMPFLGHQERAGARSGHQGGVPCPKPLNGSLRASLSEETNIGVQGAVWKPVEVCGPRCRPGSIRTERAGRQLDPENAGSAGAKFARRSRSRRGSPRASISNRRFLRREAAYSTAESRERISKGGATRNTLRSVISLPETLSGRFTAILRATLGPGSVRLTLGHP